MNVLYSTVAVRNGRVVSRAAAPDFNAGYFHLTAAPFSIASTAQWRTAMADIDGDPRPSNDREMDAAGSDAP
ncbi:MAG: hypothetical protein AAGF11_43715 [Myxococcota bacterium]